MTRKLASFALALTYAAGSALAQTEGDAGDRPVNVMPGVVAVLAVMLVVAVVCIPLRKSHGASRQDLDG